MGKVTTVEISGDSYPISFGMAALAEFLDSAELQLSELENLESKLTLTLALQLVHIGLTHGGRKGGRPYNGSFLETCDLMDTDGDAMAKVLHLFSESLPMPDDEKKAKAPAKSKRPPRSQLTH